MLPRRDEWRYSTTECGGRSVMTSGMRMMPLLSVISWASLETPQHCRGHSLDKVSGEKIDTVLHLENLHIFFLRCFTTELNLDHVRSTAPGVETPCM